MEMKSGSVNDILEKMQTICSGGDDTEDEPRGFCPPILYPSRYTTNEERGKQNKQEKIDLGTMTFLTSVITIIPDAP